MRQRVQGLLRKGEDTNTDNSQMGAIKEGSTSTSRSLFNKGVKCCESPEEAANLAKQYELRQINRRLDFLNELIVLVRNGRDGDDLSEIEELLDEALVDWIFHKETEDDSSTWSALRNNWEEATEFFMLAEPRRKTVRALLKASQLESGEHFSLAYVAGTMYHLLHDRVAATQEDWYEEFLQIASTHSREDADSMFSLGLRYLKQCGLISEKLRVGSRSDIVYERAKLVWCGGD
jgi:hypothetical protein